MYGDSRCTKGQLRSGHKPSSMSDPADNGPHWALPRLMLGTWGKMLLGAGTQVSCYCIIPGLIMGAIALVPCSSLAQEDATPPRVDSLSVVPSAVDVTLGPASVHMRVVITDDLSGMGPNGCDVGLNSPSGGQRTARTLDRTGGTDLVGVYEGDLPLPRYCESGSWVIDLYVRDNVLNQRSYQASELASLGLPSGIRVSPYKILSIADVAYDHGRRVRVNWYPEAHDAPGGYPPIVGYSIWRRIDQRAKSVEILKPAVGTQGLSYPPGNWDYVKTIPAHCEELYSTVCETLCDSTITQGLCWSVFFVRGETLDPRVFFDTEPDSGYSVDNLGAPGAVVISGFAAVSYSGGILLNWSTEFESDHVGFHVHRATAGRGDYVRVTTRLIVAPGPYEYRDAGVTPGATYRYRLEAVDRSGTSEFFGPIEAKAAGAADLPAFMLSQNQPNPFVAERGATAIAFTLGEGVHTTLRVFDATGRLVRFLVDAPLDAGPHTVLWDGRNDKGAEAGSGIYYYRLDAGEFSEARALVKLR